MTQPDAPVPHQHPAYGDLPAQVHGLAVRFGLRRLQQHHDSRAVLGTYVLINSAEMRMAGRRSIRQAWPATVSVISRQPGVPRDAGMPRHSQAPGSRYEFSPEPALSARRYRRGRRLPMQGHSSAATSTRSSSSLTAALTGRERPPTRWKYPGAVARQIPDPMQARDTSTRQVFSVIACSGLPGDEKGKRAAGDQPGFPSHLPGRRSQGQARELLDQPLKHEPEFHPGQ